MYVDPLLAATVTGVASSAALAGLAAILDLYARLLDATDAETFDDVNAEIAVARAELFPVLDVARGQGLGGPLADVAAELRRHVDPDRSIAP